MFTSAPEVTDLAQAGAGPRLTWDLRDPRASVPRMGMDWATLAVLCSSGRIDVSGESGPALTAGGTIDDQENSILY